MSQTSTPTPKVKAAKKLKKCLPKSFTKVLQALVCGTGVKVTLVYSSRDNERYTMRLEGPWHDLLRRCVIDANNERSSFVYPVDADLGGIDAWPSVLLKMQFADDADDEEDECHTIVTKECPGIAPKFLVGMTVGGVRLGFMEWLDDCTTMSDLYQSRSPMLKSVAESAAEKVQRLWMDAGVLHGDLHTDNVLVSSTGEVFLIDFGMSIRIDDSVRLRLKEAINSKKTRPANAYDDLCKEHAFKALSKRGYKIEKDDEEWNDDGSFLRLLNNYVKKARRTENVKVHVGG